MHTIDSNKLLKIGLIAVFAIVVSVFGPTGSNAAADLQSGAARALIAQAAGMSLSKDAVQVKQISVTANSAVVVAQIETAFRLQRDGSGAWHVAEVRVGKDKWEDVELLARALNAEKTARALTDIEMLATALDAYKRERGAYVAAETGSELVDQLHPRFLNQVIRIDPWHRPYLYKGSARSYQLSSDGADGKPGTSDDLSVTK
jgi:Type II secretion system (T2SS), protein G